MSIWLRKLDQAASEELHLHPKDVHINWWDSLFRSEGQASQNLEAVWIFRNDWKRQWHWESVLSLGFRSLNLWPWRRWRAQSFRFERWRLLLPSKRWRGQKFVFVSIKNQILTRIFFKFSHQWGRKMVAQSQMDWRNSREIQEKQPDQGLVPLDWSSSRFFKRPRSTC